MQDIRSITGTAVAMTHAVRTASANGTAVDLQGYSAALVVVQAHAVSTADATNGFTFKLQDSPDNSTWTDVAIGDVAGTVAIASTGVANTVIGSIAYVPTSKAAVRYIRLVATAAGTTSAAFTAMAVLQGGRVK